MKTDKKGAKSAVDNDFEKMHDENVHLENEIASLQAKLAELEQKRATATPVNPSGLEEVATSPSEINEIVYMLTYALNFIINHGISNLHLSTQQRRRLRGAGERRWGMIEKTFDIARENPVYFSSTLTSYEGMSLLVRNVELWREADDIAERLSRIAKDHYLVTSNAAYAMARIYYRNLQTAANSGDPDAQVLFNELRTYYKPMGRRKNASEETTIDELVRDVKALAHGRKEGEITVKNRNSKTARGERIITDSAHKPGEGSFHETRRGIICGKCGAESPEHAKFCINCAEKLG